MCPPQFWHVDHSMDRIKSFLLMLVVASIAVLVPLKVLCQPSVIHFSSLDAQQPYKLSGTLYLPPNSAGPVPAIVLVHGTAGINETGLFYRQPLLDAGVAIFEVNFKTGVFSGTMDRPHIVAFVPMAFAALQELRKNSSIDPDRIAIMGFSMGGGVTLRTAIESYKSKWLGESKGFAAFIAFYPVCKPFMLELAMSGSQLTGAPMIIFYGTEDSYGEGKAAPELKLFLARKYHFEVTTVEYPGATHDFNRNVPPMNYADPAAIGGRATTAWNPTAANDSLKRTIEFVRQNLGAR